MGPVIRAHTIQRTGGLSPIAGEGHVYSFRPNDARSLLRIGEGGPHLVGLRRASTFTGFCGRHDTSLFRPLETAPVVPTREQSLLLMYRAICYELFQKRWLARLEPLYRSLDRGWPREHQYEWQAKITAFLRGAWYSERELQKLKATAEESIVGTHANDVRAFVVQFPRIPSISSTGILNPEFDFSGRRIQFLGPGAAQWVGFSLLPVQNGGVAVFSWLPGAEACAIRIVSGLTEMPAEKLADALIRFSFEMVANTYASPEWWEGLQGRDRDRLRRRMYTGGVLTRDPNALCDDGLRLGDWGIPRQFTPLL